MAGDTRRRISRSATVLDKALKARRAISPQVKKCLQVWQAFIRAFPKNEELPSFPIWSMEFGATYPFEEETPQRCGTRRLSKYRGSHGIPLKGIRPQARMEGLPSYARNKEKKFPHWKVLFIRQNREFYNVIRSGSSPGFHVSLIFRPACRSWSGTARARSATFGTT